MSKDKKLESGSDGSSETTPTVLTPVSLAKTPGVAKVFILTPQILQKLGLAGHFTARIASRDAEKKEDTPTAQGSEVNLNEKSRKPGNTINEVVERAAGSNNKRKRECVSTGNADKTSETLNSCISTQLEQRLNGTKQKILVEGNKSEQRTWTTQKTNKRRQRSNVVDMLNAQPENSENVKESKDESSKSTPGVRTSKRVVKLKRFDDYILTDDVLFHAVSSNTGGKVKQRRSSANSKNTDSVVHPRTKIRKKELADANTVEKIELSEEKNSEKGVGAIGPKLKNLETKDRVSSQEIQFKVPESRIDCSKKESQKTHEKSKPKEKRLAEKTALDNEKKTKEGTETTTSKPLILETETSESADKVCTGVTKSPTNVSQKELHMKDVKRKPEKKSAREKVAPKKNHDCEESC